GLGAGRRVATHRQRQGRAGGAGGPRAVAAARRARRRSTDGPGDDAHDGPHEAVDQRSHPMTTPTTPSRVPSLGWMVAWNAARRPDAAAIREPDGPPIDYRTLAGRVGALAARLRDVGVVPG